MAIKRPPVLKQVSNPVQRPKKKRSAEGSIGHLVVPSPKIRKKVTPSDLHEANDMGLVITVDLKRQPDASVFAMEIDEGQRYYPYGVLTRLFVGWESVSHVSSFEMKLTPAHPLPQMTIRFVEALTPEQVKELDPGVRAAIEASIAKVRQFPFIVAESPLLAKKA